MELYIIRHGETDWNKEKRLQGRSDTELNAYGIELAQITAEALKDINFDCIYSSPLKRAYKTAEIIRRHREIEIKTDERLKEISFGVMEGVPMKERPESFQKFFTDPANYVAPNGGESYEELVARTKDFIEDVVVTNSKTMERMLIVAHGALNKALMLNLNHDNFLHRNYKKKNVFNTRHSVFAGPMKNAFFHCNPKEWFLQAKTTPLFIQKYTINLVHFVVRGAYLPAGGTGVR